MKRVYFISLLAITLFISACSSDSSNTIGTPEINTTASSAVCCEGSPIVLTAATNSELSGLTYVWYLNEEIIPSATSATYTASQAGKYSVKAKLGEQTSRMSDFFTLDGMPMNYKPVIASSATGGGSVTLAVTNPLAGVSYGWYKDGSLIVEIPQETFVATATGTYTVVAVANSCSSVSSEGEAVAMN